MRRSLQEPDPLQFIGIAGSMCLPAIGMSMGTLVGLQWLLDDQSAEVAIGQPGMAERSDYAQRAYCTGRKHRCDSVEWWKSPAGGLPHSWRSDETIRTLVEKHPIPRRFSGRAHCYEKRQRRILCGSVSDPRGSDSELVTVLDPLVPLSRPDPDSKSNSPGRRRWFGDKLTRIVDVSG
jgi:hypothetical protein